MLEKAKSSVATRHCRWNHVMAGIFFFPIELIERKKKKQKQAAGTKKKAGKRTLSCFLAWGEEGEKNTAAASAFVPKTIPSTRKSAAPMNAKASSRRAHLRKFVCKSLICGWRKKGGKKKNSTGQTKQLNQAYRSSKREGKKKRTQRAGTRAQCTRYLFWRCKKRKRGKREERKETDASRFR